MKSPCLRAVLLGILMGLCSAVQTAGAAPVKPLVTAEAATSFNLTGVKVADVLQVIFGDALKTPYLLDPDVTSDQRVISFRWSTDAGDLKTFLMRFLDSLGYEMELRDGLQMVRKRRDTEVQAVVYVYRPQFREVGFLTDLLGPLFKGGFTVNRTVKAPEGGKLPQGASPPPNSVAAQVDRSSDILVFAGTQSEVDRLKAVLPQVDVPFGEVMVRGMVYEVSTTNSDGSAFGLLAQVLGGKVSAGIGTLDPLGSFVRFKNVSLDAVYSMLSQDSRFKVVSSPSLRIRSGASGSFSVGEDVPVLGAVTYPANGQAVQSVEYRSSGVLFNIQPTVREGVIDLAIDQQLSNFVATTTGVNNSPTLTKRALKTSVGMQDGDLIVLGGLTQNKDTSTRDGMSFLPRAFHTTGTSISKGEVLLVLQVHRI